MINDFEEGNRQKTRRVDTMVASRYKNKFEPREG
jgi:hypothetical protein